MTVKTRPRLLTFSNILAVNGLIYALAKQWTPSAICFGFAGLIGRQS